MLNTVSFNKKVSFCVLPVDSFTREIYRGYLNILVDDTICKPIKKPNGLYIFTDIDKKSVKLSIDARNYKYFENTINIEELNPLNPIVQIRLRPDSDYRFSGNACGVMFTVVDKNKKQLTNRKIYSYISDMSSFEALLDEDLDKSKQSVKLYNVYGNNIEYTSYKIMTDNEHEGNEYIDLGRQLDDGRYEILNKLRFNHNKKDILLNSYITDSDQSGDVLIVFNKLYKASSRLTVEIEINKTFKEVNLDLKENSIVNMGCVTFK